MANEEVASTIKVIKKISFFSIDIPLYCFRKYISFYINIYFFIFFPLSEGVI